MKRHIIDGYMLQKDKSIFQEADSGEDQDQTSEDLLASLDRSRLDPSKSRSTKLVGAWRKLGRKVLFLSASSDQNGVH